MIKSHGLKEMYTMLVPLQKLNPTGFTTRQLSCSLCSLSVSQWSAAAMNNSIHSQCSETGISGQICFFVAAILYSWSALWTTLTSNGSTMSVILISPPLFFYVYSTLTIIGCFSERVLSYSQSAFKYSHLGEIWANFFRPEPSAYNYANAYLLSSLLT